MPKIALAQIDIAFADRARNLARMVQVLEETAASGAKLTVFPEAALAGYCFDSLDEARPHAEPIPGPSTERMTSVCRELGCHAIYGLLEADGEQVFNACVLVGPEGVVGSYRKIHLPFLGVDRFTTPGDRPFAVHEAAGMRIGMHICYDGGFPESARVLTLLGADLVVLPTNWPPGAECMAGCVVNARAMENNIYYAAVDRVGEERGFAFIGQSKVCDPRGGVVAEAAHDREEIFYAEIDVALARQKKIVRRANLHEIDRIRDRRPEMYGPLAAPSPPQ
ncbi:MAG: carbon-nitrogen hydrolase family protein [Pirellulaceae bacterium]